MLNLYPLKLSKVIFVLLAVIMAGVSAARTTGVVVMTYNIHHGADGAEKNTLDEIGQFISEQAPDFVGLQEVDQACTRSGSVLQMERLAAVTGMQPAFAAHFEYQGGHYGNGLLSRHPLSNIKNHRLTLLKKDGTTDTRSLLVATATLPDGTTLTVATAHFALDHPSRMLQTSETLEWLKPFHQRVIFMGDLNCTPESPEIAVLKGNGFIDCDRADLPTFPVPQAEKKIDYIFISHPLNTTPASATVPAVPLSDHLPVVARIPL